MKNYITEFIGTFFLVLTIGLTVNSGAGDMAPLAIGGILMAMVYAGGHMSGAHYNPAITLAMLIRRRITFAESVPYILAQLAAAVVAAFAVKYFLPGERVLPEVAPANPDAVKALIAEALGTFALAYVVLNVATTRATNNNNYYGLAIGITVTALAYAFGGISGAAFNPAVAVGVSVLKMAAWSDIWIYLVGCFGGAALAGLLFRLQNPDDK